MGLPLVVVAASARALAQCLRRAGMPEGGAPLLAVDAFGDDDLLAAVDGYAHVALPALHDADALCAAVDAVLAGHDAATRTATASAHLMLGGGFDGATTVLNALARRHSLLNTSPESWAAARDPLLFVRLGIETPETRLTPPEDARGWLCKARGSSAGLGVRPAQARPAGIATVAGSVYWQRRIAGTPVSLLFCAHSGGIVPVGINRQWCSPAPGLPFRFAGIASGFDPGAAAADQLLTAAARLTEATGLRGLASLDAVLDRRGCARAIEVNPRPSASVELYDRTAPGLLRLHLAAVRGCRLPAWAPAAGSHAFTLVRAPCPLVTGPRPPDTADWQEGAQVARGAPVCTFHAAAPGIDAALRRSVRGAARLRRALAPHRQPEGDGFFYNALKIS